MKINKKLKKYNVWYEQGYFDAQMDNNREQDLITKKELRRDVGSAFSMSLPILREAIVSFMCAFLSSKHIKVIDK